MIVFPNCKINLGLSVIEKRADNFHNLETIFYPVPLKDALEIVPSKNKDLVFQSSGLPIPGDPSTNLVTKAYHLLKEFHDLPGVRVHLHKNIPMGAGLGGGSSDAAFTLILLDKLFKLNLSKIELEAMASKLGADCSFFIENSSVFASAKGTQFEPIKLDLTGKFILIVKPNLHIGTAEAYAGITPLAKTRHLDEIIKGNMSDWETSLINDFEKHIFLKHPEIGQIKQELYTQGAVYSAMSGSGSAVYGIFEEAQNLKHKFPNYFCWGSIL